MSHRGLVAWYADRPFSKTESDMALFYHGTAWAFDQFADCPLFFTPDFAAAAAYARDCRVPADGPHGTPVVLSVELDTSDFVELDRAAFLDLFEIDDEREDSGCWEALSNYAWEKGEEGYSGVLVRGVYDYCGGEGDRRSERPYDQAVVVTPSLLKIVARVPVSSTELGWVPCPAALVDGKI